MISKTNSPETKKKPQLEQTRPARSGGEVSQSAEPIISSNWNNNDSPTHTQRTKQNTQSPGRPILHGFPKHSPPVRPPARLPPSLPPFLTPCRVFPPFCFVLVPPKPYLTCQSIHYAILLRIQVDILTVKTTSPCKTRPTQPLTDKKKRREKKPPPSTHKPLTPSHRPSRAASGQCNT